MAVPNPPSLKRLSDRLPVAALRFSVVASVLALGILATGCGSAHSGSGVSSSSAVLFRKPLPAGKNPSEISKMVCATKAQKDIAEVLGEKAVVATPTWVGHLYACTFQYPSGSFVLSVKELSSWDETFSYFRSLGSQLGNAGGIQNLGQGAFSTSNGSVVVRKDWKVLLVDISGLPSQFGVPPTPSRDVAVTVADLILGCWEGD